MTHFRMTSALAIGLALGVATPALAQSEPLQIIAPGEVPLPTGGSKALNAALADAEQAALINAWIVVKRHPDVALKVRNLSVEQNNALAQGLKPRCQSTMLNYEVDKKLKRLNARYRFDCNLLDVEMDIDRLVRSAPPSENAPSRPRLATFFIVKEVASQTVHDADIDRYARSTSRTGTTQRDTSTTTYNADMRARLTAREGYGEDSGAVSDSMTTRNQNKGRVKLDSTTGSDVSSVNEASLRSNGRTITRAADQAYRPASPEQLNANLTDVFKNARTRINHYADIYGQCPGPNPDSVTAEFGRKSEDLTTPVRTGIQQALRKCGFRYMLLGDALVDTTQADATTGSPRVSVVLTAKIWDIGDTFPEVVATVQKTASASNSNVNLAKNEAMFQASQRVGEEVLSRMSAEGVR